MPSESIPIPPNLPSLLAPHLPPSTTSLSSPAEPPPTTPSTPSPLSPSSPSPPPPTRPFLTLTFATSLDSSLSLSPGTRTTLSGPLSKAMTHYLRAHHASILIGVGTALADDPGLNTRIEGGEGRSPRPIILDPKARWAITSEAKVLQLAKAGEGLAPYIMIGEGVQVPRGREDLLGEYGGKFLRIKVDEKGRFKWEDVLGKMGEEGLGSVMVEGGGEVINGLLRWGENGLVDKVIVTIAPTWLGKGGVVVSPERTKDEGGREWEPVRLTGVEWIPLGEDVVLCGKILR